ncbi:MAG: hypothetical protein NTY45_10170 [Elusimicrobia bacterium]|nr:hypothetical protein [Elusimicrobiota bacterium]
MIYVPSRQIKYSLLFLTAIAILSYAPVFASPPAPAPLCRITGVIKSVEFKDAYNEACLTEPSGCPTDTELHHPARFFFDININSVSHTCVHMYPVGSVRKIFIGKDKVKPGDTFSAGQKIEGVVRSSWGSSFDSYELGTEDARPVKQVLSGRVVSGGDVIPEGLSDAPRKFIYQVRQDNAAIIKVTYTAYPPSPAGEREGNKIRLSFYAGSVKTGDYIKASGSFDNATRTLTVADDGDYIETSAGPKPRSNKRIR